MMEWGGISLGNRTNAFLVKSIRVNCARSRPAFLLLCLTGFLLGVATLGRTQEPPPAPPLATARRTFLGASVKIKGPLESSSPGLLALYMNWRIAKKDPQGRYHAALPISLARLPYGYERRPGSIIAVQLSDIQPKIGGVIGPGSLNEARDSAPNFDFVVKFDDGATGVCTSSLDGARNNFDVVSPKLTPKK